ncbi:MULTISPECIES: conjugative transposon protein TraN [Bacteroidales]|jgi:conjugative transposon TraN protein|nr:conjugative transposon protein TraN [Parabacteroides distasonis]MCE9070443.1 conjugative transposon protein TraN [Parabacteroides distasonis]
MKRVILMMAFAIGMTGAYAQKTVKVEKTENNTEKTADSEETETMPLSDKENARRSSSTGDLFDGLTRPVTFDRMIPPYALEVTFNKTVHLIFPAAIKYVDLGSADILAGKADGSENVLRVKAALRDFSRETNLAVITDDGSYYTFNVKYADEPTKLNIEMKDFIHDGEAVNRPNNSQEIYLTELGNESPLLVRLIMKSVYDNNKRLVKHIGCKRFGIQYILKGIYTHNGLLYFHTELKNASNVPFSIDFITFKVVDKKVAKRTAIQEQVIVPLRAFNYVTTVHGKSNERTVFTLPKFTLPDDKQLIVEMNEQNGGRHQQFILTNAELIRAKVINELKVK